MFCCPPKTPEEKTQARIDTHIKKVRRLKGDENQIKGYLAANVNNDDYSEMMAQLNTSHEMKISEKNEISKNANKKSEFGELRQPELGEALDLLKKYDIEINEIKKMITVLEKVGEGMNFQVSDKKMEGLRSQ